MFSLPVCLRFHDILCMYGNEFTDWLFSLAKSVTQIVK